MSYELDVLLRLASLRGWHGFCSTTDVRSAKGRSERVKRAGNWPGGDCPPCKQEGWSVKKVRRCKHRETRFHSIQRLGGQPPIELRQCLSCHSTISVPINEGVPAGGVAASH